MKRMNDIELDLVRGGSGFVYGDDAMDKEYQNSVSELFDVIVYEEVVTHGPEVFECGF